MSTSAVASLATMDRGQPPAPFVVGVARSGTTLLRMQLDAHPDLAIPAETGFGSIVARLTSGDAGPDEFLDAVVGLETWPDMRLDREELAAALARLPEWSVGEGLRAIYLTYAAGHGKRRWGDKTPLHAEYMDVLAEALPEARFIHLIRDGRDVATSLRGLPFAPGDGSIEAIATAWRDGIATARRLSGAVPHYREVRYEQLVEQPAATLRELCEFIELRFDDSMLRAHERARERLGELASVRIEGDRVHLAGDGPGIVTRTTSPPDPSRIGRWREALGAEEVARFEAVAGGALEALGYERSSRNRPTTRRTGEPRKAADTTARMRIVLGTHHFAQPWGTESYVSTVARELQRLGHEPIVTAEELGPVADFAERSGIPVARTSMDLPAECDVLFTHDAISAATLAERYPEARLVHFAHSDLHDHQLPILLPEVVSAVVVGSDLVLKRIRALALDVPIVRLRQPIDTERFAPGGPIRERPRRALLLSNYLHGERRRALMDAWEAAGVECVQLGAPTGPEIDVIPAIREADIVVGKARAALEGMSCARAVYVYDQLGGDGWVTPAGYAALEANNFAGLATAPRTPDDLAADLEAYRPEMGWINHELVRIHHSARRHTAQLVEVLRGSPPRGGNVTALSEIARLTRSNWHAERRTMVLQSELVASRERSLAAESETETSRNRAGELEQQSETWRNRAGELELELERARAALSTRRVRAGLALGRALDRLRRRR